MDGPEDRVPRDGPIQDIAEPGIRMRREFLPALRREVANLLHRNQTGFPGAQPVSFARRHLQELREKDYFVCEKSDGIRYLLYLTEENGRETVYLIDRKNDFWHVGNTSAHFPLKDDMQAFHTRTIIDGELVIDVEDGKNVPRFLVFDCLVLDGQDLTKRSYDKRIAYVKEGVIKPYKELFNKFPEERAFQPFDLIMKTMEFSYGIHMLFNVVLPNLKHGNDGLIFTCVQATYKHGTDNNILKWKPPEENTIDLRLRLEFPTIQPGTEGWDWDGVDEPFVDYESVPRAALWSFLGDGRYEFFADLHITEEEWETLKRVGDPLVDRIVECHKDHHGRWRPLRFRDDKAEANHISTVNSVLESIEDGVSQSDLETAAKDIKEQWKLRASRARR
ncbi:hypothetical protein ACRALDRAFT_1044680 [Sodiomyces alcalophilus JCM 7366]|uniref:uncharacterized protein n=1 Tax=Sodiomyces alcalophilus JCM 7366 TaxID=591952 RepID=UPI0039B5DB58